jgi:conjugal transfer/entry exclusion protein
VKKLVLGVILLAIPVLAAQDDKPLPQDSQVKILKAVRQLQQIQMQMSDLQRQARELQVYMENECVAAAKASNVDLAKFNCDVDKLTFVPKPEKKAEEKKEEKKP